MIQKENFILMAKYNQWMNHKIYQSSSTLNQDILSKDLGAFFHSILGTLNHILVADIIWLQRFAHHPRQYKSLNYITQLESPKTLAQILYTDLDKLRLEREKVDQLIIDFCNECQEEDFHTKLNYKNMKGEDHHKGFGYLLQHFFNHQTHHRGQITTLLFQQQIDIGVTDLLAMIPND